jgi:UDP-2,3-diacylglucosamine pyrophosphatase LpxH
MTLKTFVHISDIHFSDSNHESKALALYAAIPKLDGFLGHDYQSLTMLDDFFANMVATEEAELIVTGDITRVGAVLEFDLARTYLESEFVPPEGYFVGLREPDWVTRGIPGNHDHYPGIPLLIGGPTAGLAATFPNPHLPRVFTSPLGSDGHELTFLLINTDADVPALHLNRLAARGSFVSQIDELEKQLGKKRDMEIRILCLHHSRAHHGTTLEMDQTSRDRLSNFILEQGVAVLLSGHIHQPPLVRMETAVHTADDTVYADYLEARCGTTTQKNLFHIPYYWRGILHKLHLKKRGHWSNTLLVHRISQEDGAIVWESDLFEETPHGFDPAPPAHLYCMVNPRVRLWPPPVVAI